MTTTIISRDDAIGRIADGLRDRTHYVIAAGPDHVDSAAEALAGLPDVDVFVDNGTGPVLVGTPDIAYVTVALSRAVTTVSLVPKSTDASEIHDRFDGRIPTDGSQDIVLLIDAEPPFAWPLLFIDAIGAVEPAAAEAIRATDITRQS